jgi:hypothetical protein
MHVTESALRRRINRKGGPLGWQVLKSRRPGAYYLYRFITNGFGGFIGLEDFARELGVLHTNESLVS